MHRKHPISKVVNEEGCFIECEDKTKRLSNIRVLRQNRYWKNVKDLKKIESASGFFANLVPNFMSKT